MKLDNPKPVEALLNSRISGYPLAPKMEAPRPGRKSVNRPVPEKPEHVSWLFPEKGDEAEKMLTFSRREATGAWREVTELRGEAGKYQQLPVEAPLPYGLSMEEVSRMAKQLMTVAQIAARFALPEKVLIDCFTRYPKLRHAFELGAAKTIDRATEVMVDAMDAGDLAATKFILERKGGWQAPRDNIVVINGGLASMPQIDGSHVIDMAAQQRALRDAPDAEMAD